MKLTSSVSFLRRTAVLLFAGTVLSLASASAQMVAFTFSGGSGSNLTISWSSPITYTINATPNTTNNYPSFVIEDLGNLLGGTNATTAIASATATFSRTSPTSNGPFSLATNGNVGSGLTGAGGTDPIAPTDTYLFDSGISVGAPMAIGDTFVLSAGSVTIANFAGLAPSSGSYNTFLADTNGKNLGVGITSSVPEPSTYAALAGVAMLAFAAWRRKRAAK